MSDYKVGDVVALRATIVKPPKHAQTEADTVWLESQTDRLEAVPAEAAEIASWPDAERMALLEALVATVRNLDAPMVEAIEFNWCAYCHKSDPATLADHEPDCEWRLLREAAL